MDLRPGAFAGTLPGGLHHAAVLPRLSQTSGLVVLVAAEEFDQTVDHLGVEGFGLHGPRGGDRLPQLSQVCITSVTGRQMAFQAAPFAG